MTRCHEKGGKMPKTTFYNLNQEKRKNIENALIKEFEKNSIDKLSISKIIKQANIPRGSFYQYFEDKDDAINYIINRFIEVEHKKVCNFLVETKGDIFEASIKIFDDMVENLNDEKKIKLCKNILEELRKNNINIFERKNALEEKKDIESIIDISKLNIEKEEDIKYFIGIIAVVTRALSIDVIKRKISPGEGRKILIKEFNILKQGMCK